ncbi:MAG: pitrilysin family protein [Gemmatimonadaceae bacterium]
MRKVFSTLGVVASFAALNVAHAQVTIPRGATTIAVAKDTKGAGDTLTSKFEVAGIPVILRQVTANNVVAANLYLLGGVRQLTPATQGIETLLLEATEYGTRKYPKNVLRQKMARLGSAIAVSPGIDWTNIGVRSTTTGFDSTWVIMADRLMAPLLLQPDIDLVKEQLLEALKGRNDSPDALLDHLADSVTYAGSPYALDPIGTSESIAKLSLADLKKYQAEQIVTSRMMLVIVGNVSRTRVEKLVRESLGRLPKGTYSWSAPPDLPSAPYSPAIVKRALPTNYLQGSFRGPRANSKEYAALRLATAVLSGRLFTEARARQNLTYSINAPFVERAQSMGGLYVTTTSPDAVLKIMMNEISDLKEGMISEDGLDRLVQQFIVTYFLDNETNADQANILARAELYQGDYKRASQFVDDLRQVTPKDIQRAAGKYMVDVRWAYVGDPSKLTLALLNRF